MHVSGIIAQHFRSHKQTTLKLSNTVTVILGKNASGKTSLLEALYLCATGDSFRAKKIAEMVSFADEIGRVRTQLIDDDNDATDIEVMVTRGVVQGKKTPHRVFSLNGVRKQKRSVKGLVSAVLFRPEDMRLIEGSPARRRGYIDAPLSLLFDEYERSLKQYDNVLRRRNKLLIAVREREQPATVLHYWNQALIKEGVRIQQYRQKMISFLEGVPFSLPFVIEYLPSIISEQRLKEYEFKEQAAGHSLIGPHKDDFMVMLQMGGELRDIASFGSRGQQRLAVLWLKVAELLYVEQCLGRKPILLLDDILSELDGESQKIVIDLLHKHQVILTTTDQESVDLLQSNLQVPLQVVKI